MNHPQPATASAPARAIVIDELTATLVPSLQRKLQQALTSEGPQLVVDLEPLRVIDSAGIGLLIAAKNSVAEQQGQIRLLNVPAPVFNLLKSMRLISCLNAELASNDSDSDDDLERYFDEAQVA
ncbi:MAG: STAS domain-containing protein [Lamprobacter sp.]|uniref:STAS domain-containing protein n=1 Tax=Lamprobacter sp. TaxID=3100796 RepID=UPI002B25D3F3|nr:STAS domain-containing protein [Lamprobacter sp.]MEA3639089.1 STAS domain-containing protein [Lamprobacter sp.]